MKIGEIKKYGLFNSEKDYANLKYSPQRTVSFFEFDYILSCQKNATSYIDGNAYKIAPNTLILRKPNQKAHSRLHFKCYCLHLEIPRSAPLFEQLFSMPQFFTFLHEERYQTLFETLFQHLLKNDDCENDYFTSAKILELVYFLKRDEKHNKSIKTPLLKKETRSIQQIISYVKENYHEHLCLLTHNHLDHTDPETLCHYLSKESEVTVLASGNAWQNVRKTFGGVNNNYVQFNRGTEWTENDILFKAVYAEHSDEKAIGVIMQAEGKTYYITGDTLYNAEIFKDLPKKIDYVFLPINGKGNNMNFADGVRFCQKIRATAIPLHCGLFDTIDMNEWQYKNKKVPEFYKEIQL